MDPAQPAINEHMSSAELFGPVLHRYLGSSALSVIQGHQLAAILVFQGILGPSGPERAVVIESAEEPLFVTLSATLFVTIVPLTQCR